MSDEPTAGEATAPAVPAARAVPAATARPEPPADRSPAGETAAPDDPAAGPGEQEGAAGRPRSPWDDPRLPWQGRPRRADVACWAAIVLSGFYYLSLLPFRASLVGTHPVLLTVLNGSTEGIVSAAAFARVGHGSVVIVLLAVIPGLMKFDIIYWWAGRLWGERIINLFAQREKTQRRARRFVAWVDRRGRWLTWPAVVVALFVPVPSAFIYAVAGWTGMNWVTFLILDAVGSLAWGGMLAGLGYTLGQHAVSVAQTVSRYGLWISIAIVVLIVASQMRGVRTRG